MKTQLINMPPTIEKGQHTKIYKHNKGFYILVDDPESRNGTVIHDPNQIHGVGHHYEGWNINSESFDLVREPVSITFIP